MFVTWRDCTRAFTLLVCLALTACQPSDLSKEQSDYIGTAKPNSQGLRPFISATGLVLLAEAQLARGKIKQSAQNYFTAAMLSNNADISERAVFLARQAESTDQIEKMLNRWQQIDPASKSAWEQSIIFYSETQNIFALERSLIHLLRLEPDYRADWIASFWTTLPKESQMKLLLKLIDISSQHTNASLAMVVANLKNRLNPATGTIWLDKWIEKTKPEAYLILFRARLELPNRKKAIAFAERFQYVQNDIEIQSQLARWYGLEGNNEQASLLLRDIINRDQSRHQDLLTLGLLEMQVGDVNLAERSFKALLSNERYRSDAYYHLGRLAMRNERFALAIDRLLQVDRGDLIVEARKQMATVAFRTKNYRQAYQWFEEARLLFPERQYELHLTEAQFQITNNMATDAIPILNKALSQTPNNIEVLYTRALAYEQIGKIDSTEADLRHILKLKPNDPDALNALGYTLADRTERYKEALQLIKQALELKPESAAIRDSMGWILMKVGRLTEAKSHFEKAWEKSQDHEIAAHYGELLWRLGQKHDARRIWNMGYESGPESDKIRDTIQRLTNS